MRPEWNLPHEFAIQRRLSVWPFAQSRAHCWAATPPFWPNSIACGTNCTRLQYFWNRVCSPPESLKCRRSKGKDVQTHPALCVKQRLDYGLCCRCAGISVETERGCLCLQNYSIKHLNTATTAIACAGMKARKLHSFALFWSHNGETQLNYFSSS